MWLDHLTDDERRVLHGIEAARWALQLQEEGIIATAKERARLRIDAVQIKTARGFVFLIDEADQETIAQHRWHAVSHHRKRAVPYIQANIGGSRIYLHRFLTGAPKGSVVDHIDGDPLNNTRANLRVVNHRENSRAYLANKAKIAKSLRNFGNRSNSSKMQER